MEKENDKDDKKSDKQDKEKGKIAGKKALFVQRLLAFVLDVFIVSLIAALISAPFVDVENYLDLTNQSFELDDKLKNEEINVETYNLQHADLSYSIARNNGVLSIVTIIVEILYFVVYQIYKDGQTLGKRMMKIKVKSEEGELTMNQMIARSLVANFILLHIISFALMTFGSKNVYSSCLSIFTSIQYIVVVISLFMVMYGKDGRAIHDKLAHTKVITIK